MVAHSLPRTAYRHLPMNRLYVITDKYGFTTICDGTPVDLRNEVARLHLPEPVTVDDWSRAESYAKIDARHGGWKHVSRFQWP